MIKEIKITNFYSFSEESIVLQPDINILIGINGSGKSNFFRAVRLLKEGVAGIGLRKYIFDELGGSENIFYKGVNENKGPVSTIRLEYLFDSVALKEFGSNLNDDLIYIIEIHRNKGSFIFYVSENVKTKDTEYLNFDNGKVSLNSNGQTETPKHKDSFAGNKDFDTDELALSKIGRFEGEKYPMLLALKNAIAEIVVYDYFDTTPDGPIRRAILATTDKRLKPGGANLTQILNTIKINHKPDHDKIVQMLTEVNANFSGIDFNIYGGGTIELLLGEKGLRSSVHVSSISDGTLKYLCLMAILYNPERGRLICIDEPETGLHPDIIHGIANAIKDASEYSTIIIATHSDHLITYFNLKNLRIFEKDENNATKAVTYTDDFFEGWYDYFVLGQMWLDGDFGGVRYGG